MNIIPYKDLVEERKFIEFDKLCELVGLPFSEGLRGFSFASNCANDSYATIDCSDYGYEDVCENLAYHENHPHHNSEKLIRMFENDIQLIKILRGYYGIKETVFTYISW